MRKIGKIAQVAFTYIGTIVGAGFATGQEILQFFTKYGWTATFTILIATVLFIWLGTKLMLLSAEVGAVSYEDLNKRLFGNKAGEWISLFTLIVLFGISSVMLAGAGSLFSEHLHLPYQVGLLATVAGTYWILSGGMRGILSVNTIVVPIMLIFTALVVWSTAAQPGSGNWLSLGSDFPAHRIWFSPLLYVAFNLATSQAALVPLGAEIRDRTVLIYGGLFGGIGIGAMLLAGHFALSARMPDVTQHEIPMGHIAESLGATVQFMYLLVIFGEIFTTFIADVYGLSLQLQERTGLGRSIWTIVILIGCYAFGQFRFSILLSVLYPLFGFVSLIWFVMVVWSRHERPAGNA